MKKLPGYCLFLSIFFSAFPSFSQEPASLDDRCLDTVGNVLIPGVNITGVGLLQSPEYEPSAMYIVTHEGDFHRDLYRPAEDGVSSPQFSTMVKFALQNLFSKKKVDLCVYAFEIIGFEVK